MLLQDSPEKPWFRRAQDEWCTRESSGKFLIRRIDDYHEIVGGDFYHYIPMESYLVVAWGCANASALQVCESLDEAQRALLSLLVQADGSASDSYQKALCDRLIQK